MAETAWPLTAHGLRKDGTFGPETPTLPVACFAIVPMDHADNAKFTEYAWSDGTHGPIEWLKTGGEGR